MTSPFISLRFPYLQIRVRIDGREYEYDALIDTGFDGALVLPSGIIGSDMAPDFERPWRLADGSETVLSSYFVHIQIGEFEPIPAFAVVVGPEVLLGLTIVQNFSVLFDHGRRVIVEP